MGHTLNLERNFKASPQKVYEAWTNAGQLKKWFKIREDWTTSLAEVDLKIGGKYRIGMCDPEGQERVVGGEFSMLEPYTLIEYSWHWESDAAKNDPVTIVRVEITETDEGSNLKLTHSNFETEEVKDLHGTGWSGCLDQLSSILG
jgi:uncharacterized protein YndB with AHSA1/START domain